MADAVAQGTAEVTYEPVWDEAAPTVARIARPGDLVITVGCGDVTKVAPKIVAELERQRISRAGAPNDDDRQLPQYRVADKPLDLVAGLAWAAHPCPREPQARRFRGKALAGSRARPGRRGRSRLAGGLLAVLAVERVEITGARRLAASALRQTAAVPLGVPLASTGPGRHRRSSQRFAYRSSRPK